MQENLILIHVNNKGTDKPEHLCSLISAFVIHFLQRMLSKLENFKDSN